MSQSCMQEIKNSYKFWLKDVSRKDSIRDLDFLYEFNEYVVFPEPK
jgi:hypothetical protein